MYFVFSNGGHRRCPAIEVNAGKEHGSSVKVWLYEEFLSKEECQQLIEAHESHLTEMKKQKVLDGIIFSPVLFIYYLCFLFLSL